MVMFQFLQSYWDWLPIEIQDYIVSLATWQHIHDRRENQTLHDLLEEIVIYDKMKKAWNEGEINVFLELLGLVTR